MWRDLTLTAIVILNIFVLLVLNFIFIENVVILRT